MEANYRIVHGKRLNSRRYVHNGYIYTKTTEIKDGFILRCVRYKGDPSCSDTALCKHGELEIEPKNSHEGHGCMTEEHEVVFFANELKRAVLDNEEEFKMSTPVWQVVSHLMLFSS